MLDWLIKTLIQDAFDLEPAFIICCLQTLIHKTRKWGFKEISNLLEHRSQGNGSKKATVKKNPKLHAKRN